METVKIIGNFYSSHYTINLLIAQYCYVKGVFTVELPSEWKKNTSYELPLTMNYTGSYKYGVTEKMIGIGIIKENILFVQANMGHGTITVTFNLIKNEGKYDLNIPYDTGIITV